MVEYKIIEIIYLELSIGVCFCKYIESVIINCNVLSLSYFCYNALLHILSLSANGGFINLHCEKQYASRHKNSII